MPLTIIASTKPSPQFGALAKAFQRFWIAQSEELAGKSTRAVFIPTEGSSHHVHLAAPQLVLDAVELSSKSCPNDPHAKDDTMKPALRPSRGENDY